MLHKVGGTYFMYKSNLQILIDEDYITWLPTS